jgi:TonB family protein
MRTLESQLLAYVLNSLWQVLLIFAAAWVAARVVRPSGAAMEHRIWVSALVLEALLPACSITPSQLVRSLAQIIPWRWGSHAVGGNVSVTVTSGAAFAHSLLHLPRHLLAAIALAYTCLVALGAARLLRGLWATRGMRRRSHPIVLTGAAAHTWTHCSDQFDVRDAQVAVSCEASYPMTMGLRRRLVLLPAEFAALQEEDLVAAIAHEFAHMQRRDFAKNLAYAVLSLPIAYHPLLWLTRVRLGETREMICDAMAADAVAGPQRYARSLLRLASVLLQGTPQRTLHAIGIFDANIFERRVMNLTQKHVELRRAQRLATAAACIALGLATCASALALRMNVAAPSAQTDGQSAPQPSSATSVPSGVMAGNRLSFVQPIYPQEAKDAKLSGTVILKAHISKEGAIENLQVVSGPKKLRKSSLDAVKQWTYKPYLLNGQPTEVDTTITVNFSLAN